jgi:putative peptidoglycan lipid II flippase
MGSLAQVGLALATSIGAWINLGLVVWFGVRAGHMRSDARLTQSSLKLIGAGVVLGLVLWLAHAPIAAWMPQRHADVLTLVALAGLAAAVYGAIVLALFGGEWLKAFRRRRLR